MSEPIHIDLRAMILEGWSLATTAPLLRLHSGRPMNILVRKVLFLLGGLALFFLALLAFVAWIGVVATAFPPRSLTVFWLAIAVPCTALSAWLATRVWRVRPADVKREDPIRAAIKALPRGVKPRRSRAARAGLLTTIGWTIFGIGCVVALGAQFAELSQEESGGPFDISIAAVAILLVTGIIGGAFLGIARDSRGRYASLLLVMAIPLTFGLYVAFGGNSSEGRSADIGAGILVFVVTGVPLLAGFVAARLYLSTRPVSTPVQPALDPVRTELDDATDHGRSDAILREYPGDDDGWSLLEEDRAALEKVGYEMTVSEETDGWERNSRVIRAMFVRRVLVSRPTAGAESQGEPESG